MTTQLTATIIKSFRYKLDSEPDSTYTAWTSYVSGQKVRIANRTGADAQFRFQFRHAYTIEGYTGETRTFEDVVSIGPTSVIELSNFRIAPASQQSGTYTVRVQAVLTPPVESAPFAFTATWVAKDNLGATREAGSLNLTRVGTSNDYEGTLTIGTFTNPATVYGDIQVSVTASTPSLSIVLPVAVNHTFEDVWESTISSGTEYDLFNSPSSWNYDTLYEYGWTSVSVLTGMDLSSVKVTFADLQTDTYAGYETYLYIVAPDFTSTAIACPSSHSGPYEFDFGSYFSGLADSAGTWSVYFVDNYGDGGAVGSTGKLKFGA